MDGKYLRATQNFTIWRIDGFARTPWGDQTSIQPIRAPPASLEAYTKFRTSAARTTMSLSLPPEILDLVVEHLYSERPALKTCCLVSKSWVPRARRHLFFRVRFHSRESSVESWMKAFPDPSNSPAHYTRDLSIRTLRDIIVATTIGDTWICTFCNIVNLTVEASVWDCSRASLVPLHALSPSLESLCLIHNSIPSSDVFSFICSFPSLEALSLISIGDGDEEANISTLPSTSPRFTGALCLVMRGGMRSDIRRLIALPGGLHFTKIWVGCLAEDLGSITSLVSACRDTLVSFTILQYFPSAS